MVAHQAPALAVPERADQAAPQHCGSPMQQSSSRPRQLVASGGTRQRLRWPSSRWSRPAGRVGSGYCGWRWRRYGLREER